MIVDSHIHYTQTPTPERPHVPGAAARVISYDDVIAVARAAGIDRLVQVTPSCMGHDNRYALEGAAARPEALLGVVGRFDPFAPELRERLRAYRSQRRILGVRLTLHQPPASSWLAEGVLSPFFAEAQEQEVPLFIYAPNQARELQATARRFPRLRLVIDHTALQHGAGMTADQVFARWDDVIALAREPNVWMKVSFFPEAAARSEPFPWPSSALRFRQLVDAAGTDRMVWGSNFPPVLAACPLVQAVDFIRTGCDFLQEEQKRAILGGNFLRDFAR